MSGEQPENRSPFHLGEIQAQERAGVREKVELTGRRMVRDHMPDQHRDFYVELPFVLLGAVDDRGRPWASLVAGQPGFMTSPDPRTLDVAALPPSGDPLNETLKTGTDIGVLGIQLETRRRNRISGTVGVVRPDGFVIHVNQAFGNCPKYIQTRAVAVPAAFDGATQRRPVSRSDRLDPAARALIARADTFFMATAYGENRTEAAQGADVSHRGGKPGFVRVKDDRSLVFPDFSGNNLFNSIGNILLNPKAGLLFVDFTTGDLVYLTGTAEIVWDGEAVRRFAGAERLVGVHVDEMIRVERSLPLRFTFGEVSPRLDQTGSWSDAETSDTARGRPKP